MAGNHIKKTVTTGEKHRFSPGKKGGMSRNSISRLPFRITMAEIPLRTGGITLG